MNSHVKFITFAAAVVGAAGILFVIDPVRHGVFPSCPLHAMTGWWCPGCGTTRALHQLLHGHLAAAFALNPLTMSLLPAAGYVAWRGGNVSIRPAWFWMLLFVVVAFGIVRNISLTP